MDKLFQLIGDVSHVKLGGADTYTDQLNCRYTVFVLSLFAFIATARVYVDEPISCFCPAEFEASQVAFAKKVCWTTNTFYLPEDKELTNANRENSTARISYYQWVTLIFSLQAFLFYLPRPIWRMLNKKSGIAVNIITDAAIECQRHRDDGYDKTMKYMTQRVGQFLTGLSRKRQNAGCFRRIGWAIYGSYLTIVYLFIKVVYVVNAVGQLFLLNAFLSTDYHLYGIDVLTRMFSGREWTTSSRFPRVTLCDFIVRKPGNEHRYTVQCALPMNLFYEMMFIFLWFWIVFVLIVTSASLLQWAFVSVLMRFQKSYVRDRLVELDRIVPELDSGTTKFVRDYLRRDGCFIIRLVAKNAGDRIAGDLVAGLWDQYAETDQMPLKKQESKSDNAIEMGGVDVQNPASSACYRPVTTGEARHR